MVTSKKILDRLGHLAKLLQDLISKAGTIKPDEIQLFHSNLCYLNNEINKQIERINQDKRSD